MRRTQALTGIPARLWRLVALARHRLLMLDYEGTLAPFAAKRDEALPLPATLQRLQAIAASEHTTVAVVSGRPVENVERLVGGIPAAFVGEHGWELRAADGNIVRRPLQPSIAATIHQAERIGRTLGWGARLERKRSGIVLHTRGLPAERACDLHGRCVSAWQGLAAPGHVVIEPIDGGVELRARGRNKGTVAMSLLSQAPVGTLGVFVGDDVTDEDAFDVVRDWGFGVRVGTGARPSLAMGWLPSCEAVPAFLGEWLRITGRIPTVRS